MALPSHVRAALRLGLAICPLLWLGAPQPVHAQQGEVCERPTYRGPVSLVILANGAKVRQLAASVKDVPVVARDAETVIFADGRVITADVEGAGEHLNQLGWASRQVRVSATFPRKRARPRSSYG